METEEKTCAQLVHEKMQQHQIRLEEINDILGEHNGDSDDESYLDKLNEALEELNEYALEITSYKVIKILMSTGGPADWIEANVDNDGYIMSMSYHYQDWFDHAETKIERNSYLWDYAEQITNSFN